MTEAFDVVVVGGGSAGCIAAAELADDPDVSVLLLEAGPAADMHPETLHADGYPDAFANDDVMAERFTAPQHAARGRRIFAGTGAVLGGSGSVNGMVYTRAAREDHVGWPYGWRWDDVAPDLDAIERTLRPRRRPATRWTEACVSAAVACGFRLSDDLNDGDLGNVVGANWMNYDGDRRRSSYVAFIRDAAERPNLEVRTGSAAHRIVFDEGRCAVAVEYAADGKLRRAGVRGEVVLCAGALETPKLLMLSGVGPRAELERLGIATVHASSDIGRDLVDHPNVPVLFLARERVDCRHPQLYSFFRTNEAASLPPGQSDTCYVFWPAASALKQSVQRLLPGMVLPPVVYRDPFRSGVRGAVEHAFRSRAVRHLVDRLFGVVVILGKPMSRGTVRLASGDPAAAAIVDPGYLTDPRDVQTLVLGVEMARRLSRSGALAAWTTRELTPGRWRASQAAVSRWVRRNAISTFHFAGTCRMGSDPSSVCDARLRLRGVRAVRVADASVIPSVPVSAPNATSMLIGYRAAHLIHEERAERGLIDVRAYERARSTPV